jgi:hypothetical protein
VPASLHPNLAAATPQKVGQASVQLRYALAAALHRLASVVLDPAIILYLAANQLNQGTRRRKRLDSLNQWP